METRAMFFEACERRGWTPFAQIEYLISFIHALDKDEEFKAYLDAMVSSEEEREFTTEDHS